MRATRSHCGTARTNVDLGASMCHEIPLSWSVLTRPVAQVTNNYGSGYLHRPDMAMLVYGFVPGREPPVMSTCDLPHGFGGVRHPQQAYPVTPTPEPDYGECIQARVRLESVLVARSCSAAAPRCSTKWCEAHFAAASQSRAESAVLQQYCSLQHDPGCTTQHLLWQPKSVGQVLAHTYEQATPRATGRRRPSCSGWRQSTPGCRRRWSRTRRCWRTQAGGMVVWPSGLHMSSHGLLSTVRSPAAAATAADAPLAQSCPTHTHVDQIPCC